MDIREAVLACRDNPGVRALVVFGQARRCREVFEATVELIPENDWILGYSGWTSRFPNGSVIEVAHLAAGLHRWLGTEFQLVVTDGISENDRLHLRVRLRSSDPGKPILGIHTLGEGVEASRA